MTTEVEEQVVVEDEEAGFESAFGDATSADEASEPAEPEAKQDEPKIAEAAPAEAAPAEEEVVTLTATEARAMIKRLDDLDKLRQLQDKAFGHIGSMQSTIQKLQQSQTSGGSVEISDEDLAELNDFAELKGAVGNTLKKILSKGVRSGTPAQIDIEPVKQEFEQRITASEQRFEQRLMTAYHRDWKQVVASDDFQLWKQTLPEQERVTLESSWNAEELSGFFDRFKESRKAKVPAQNKARRLEAAVTPSGNAVEAPELDEESAMAAALSKRFNR